jgi:hypothetical protein
MRDVRRVLVHRLVFEFERKFISLESLVILSFTLFVGQIKAKNINCIIVRSNNQCFEAKLNVRNPLLGNFLFPECLLRDHIFLIKQVQLEDSKRAIECTHSKILVVGRYCD